MSTVILLDSRSFGMNTVEFHHVPDCRCGAMRVWLELQQQEHVIQFGSERFLCSD